MVKIGQKWGGERRVKDLIAKEVREKLGEEN